MKNRATKTVFFISLSLLFFAALVYFSLDLLFRNLNFTVIGLYDTYGEKKATYNELQKVEQNLKGTLINRDHLTSLFVRQDSIVDFIQTLETMMKKSELKGYVDSVTETTEPGLEASKKEKLSLKISATGGWAGMMKFVSLLEKIPYKAAVDSMSLNYEASDSKGNISQEKSASKSEWKISIQMYTLVKKTNTKDNNAGAKNMTPSKPELKNTNAQN